VISGFLITWLLLREATGKNSEASAISLSSFYLRRLFRIAPVYYSFLLVYALLETQNCDKIDLSQWLANLTFLANYASAEGPTGHLWSLGVEEQFYLIWPWLVGSLMLYRRPNLAVIVLGSIVALAPMIRAISYLGAQESAPVLLHRFSFVRHADEIGWGCLTAYAFWFKPYLWARIEKEWVACAFVGVTLSFLPWVTGSIPGFNAVNIPFGPTLQAVGFSIIIIASIISAKSAPFSVLNVGIVKWIGVMSYSLYIWHPLFAPPRHGFDWWLSHKLGGGFWWLLPAFLCATLSYFFLERPFLSLRQRFARRS
jgi:peptidoglycan/LPS O-acetylase OafA/YrhL